MSKIPAPEMTLAAQANITALNEAWFDYISPVARARLKDPIAAHLSGLDDDTLAEIAKMSKADILSASRLGIPLCMARFKDPATYRTILKTGFSSSEVLAELSKDFPVPTLGGRK